MEGTALINLKKFKPQPTDLENEIERLFTRLAKEAPDSEQYDKITDQIKKLYPLKDIDTKKRVSPDALAATLTNLAGILLIVNYEQTHALTSKAMGMLRNIR